MHKTLEFWILNLKGQYVVFEERTQTLNFNIYSSNLVVHTQKYTFFFSLADLRGK